MPDFTFTLRDDAGRAIARLLCCQDQHDRCIPVGKVRVDVLLPVIGKGEGREIEIKEGDNTADFTLKFDAKRDMPGAAPSASASASAKPSAPPGKIPR